MKRRTLIKKVRPYTLIILVVLVSLILFRLFIKPTPCVSEVHTIQVLAVKVEHRDHLLTKFLEEKKSPLASYSGYLIEAADRYAIDWTLMPGISGIESSFGKNMPQESNNPFGIERSGHLISFPTLYKAIDFEAKLLSENYKLVANKAIGNVYCPEQTCTQNWAVKVTNFSKEIAN